MSGLRFTVGESAIVALDLDNTLTVGMQVEVLVVWPIWSHGWERWFDYVINNPLPTEDPDEQELYAMDIELRKLNPPAEPTSLTHREEVEV